MELLDGYPKERTHEETHDKKARSEVSEGPDFVGRGLWIGTFDDSLGLNEQGLREIFSRFGKISSVSIPREEATKKYLNSNSNLSKNKNKNKTKKD